MSHRTLAVVLALHCCSGASPAQVCAADKLLTTARVKPLAEIIEEQIDDGAIVGVSFWWVPGTMSFWSGLSVSGARWQPSGG